MCRKGCLFYLFLGLVCSPLQAETVLDLFKQAEEQNPEYKISGSEIAIAKEGKSQAKSTLRPQITLNASIVENWQLENWWSGESIENTKLGYNVSLSYPLYRNQLDVNVAQAETGIQQADVAYESAKQNLMASIVQRYFDVLASQDKLSNAQANKRAIVSQLDQVKAKFEVGLIPITDVQEAQAAYDLAIADEIQAKNEVDNALEALREIIGEYPQKVAVLNADIPLESPEPENSEAWVEIALKQNPSIIVAQHAVTKAHQEIQKQRADNQPTVDLVAQHRYNDTLRGNKMFGQATDNTIGIQLSYPLFEGGLRDSKIREARQRYSQALDQLEQQRRIVQQQARNAYLKVMSSISRVKAFQQAVVSTETAKKAVEESVEAELRTMVDLLNATSNVYQARTNLARARYDYVVSTFLLKQAAGMLNTEDLNALNEWLQD